MPKIIDYNPTAQHLTPSDRTLQAWETAGRRVGPLYNQAAQDIKEGGRVRGDMERAKSWPFDIYALRASNAQQIRETSSTESSTRSGDVGGGGLRVGTENPGVGPANPTTTPEAIANQQIAASEGAVIDKDGEKDFGWGQQHGEASVGAVGISRMARAAAKGQLDVNPNSNLPVDWRTNSNYNGDTLIDTPNGQFTPNQMDRFSKQYMDTWDKNMAKWNREQDTLWNGPNGWNTRRDKGIAEYQTAQDKDYQNQIKSYADQAASAYIKENPDADKAEVYRRAYEQSSSNMGGPPVQRQSTYGRYENENADYRARYGTPTVGDYVASAPAAVIDSVKSAFGAMFGRSDEPVATADIP